MLGTKAPGVDPYGSPRRVARSVADARDEAHRRARKRRTTLFQEVMLPYARSRGQAACSIVIDWEGSPFPFRVLAAHAEYGALGRWAKREGVDLSRPPVPDRVALTIPQAEAYCAQEHLNPHSVTVTNDGEVEVWDEGDRQPRQTISGREVLAKLRLHAVPATRITTRRWLGRRAETRETVMIGVTIFDAIRVRSAVARRPERRSARKATRRSAGTRRRASSTTGDDGSGSGDDPPPPAEPHGRGDEQDRGSYTGRLRSTRGDLIHVGALLGGDR